jgi:hypothetical protein
MKTQKFATPQTSNQSLIADLALCSFSQECNLVYAAENFITILLIWQHTIPYRILTVCKDSLFEKQTALFSFSNANKGRKEITKHK